MKRFLPAREGEMESIRMANVLLLFSGDSPNQGDHGGVHHPGTRVFECKTCSRRFPSFQALGGHRASHKKPRLMDQNGQQNQSSSPPAPAKPRVHECSVCGLEFAIGQALGGHMRRHRVAAAEAGAVPHALVEAKPTAAVACDAAEKREVACLGLDLNLPPCENDKNFLTLGFGRGLHMVDCSY